MKITFKRVISLLSVLILVIALLPTDIFAATYSTTKVHYIDVGQGDAVLIESNKKYMLIDTGENKKTVSNYLKKQKVKKLDYLILTHPDSDHIGGAATVIKNYSIGKVIMPSKEHTSKTYENVLLAIKNKGLKITKSKVGAEYALGKASFTIIAPNKVYKDNNNSSIGLKLVNGNTSFLFIGDAEKTAINDILTNKIDINVDVLMVGHHGADTSTTEDLLDKVKPSNAIISVGKNNYGHPTDDVLKLLAAHDTNIYRTDENGTIIATSTGKKVTIDADTHEYKEKNEVSKVIFITKTGKKYHLENCSTLKSKIKSTLQEALKKGLTPCNVCNP